MQAQIAGIKVTYTAHTAEQCVSFVVSVAETAGDVPP